ncbi:hypothetical protein ACFQ4Q_19920 [Lysobacter gummosus]|uniref:hypothetical protein n=1 Tax=Lysobacter gummosus TaxID=262324 RepID=UPI00363BE13B
MQARWIMFIALLATALIYSIGLDGPYLFDDAFNLTPVRLWAAGRLGWEETAFGNVSGVLGRPVSMASFMLSAAIGGATPLDFKVGNLVIHLACAGLIYQLLRQLLPKDERLSLNTALAASLLAALWLLHPLHVSTVLYAVQRMAQLSTLFVLASLLAYLRGRAMLSAGSHAKAAVWLFGGFPLLWLLGLLSKENAAIAPALCLVLEIAYFRREPASPRILGIFYFLILALPMALAAGVLTMKPGIVLAGYAIRDFDMLERLLSQSRALLAYIGMMAVPRGEEMGVFTDDFATSTGLLTPPSTLIALLTIALISIVAIALRRRSPHLFAGWFFFLVAHGVESTILPLELYFEHRNYLPSTGLLLMLVGLISLLPTDIRTAKSYRYSLTIGAIVVAVVFASMTWHQAKIWKSKDAIVDQALRGHPGSVRAVQAKVVAAINRRRYGEAMDLLAPMTKSTQPRTRVMAYLDMISTSCLRGSGTDATWLNQAVADARTRLTIGEMQSVGLLMQVSRDGRCGVLSEEHIANAIVALADAATDQSADILPKWQLRYAAASIYARIGLWPQALTQVQLVPRPQAPAEVNGLFIQALAYNKRRPEAELELRALSLTVDARDRQGQAILKAAGETVSNSELNASSSQDNEKP